MSELIRGETIKALREKRHLTQKQVADRVLVSDKTISKWETGRGLPDITLLEPLARALGTSVAELLSGRCIENRNRAANLLRGSFYVCPLCGNVLFSVGQGAYSCCGITLPPQEAEPEDEAHRFRVEAVEGDLYVTLDHPMEREHYLSLIAYGTQDQLLLRKLYPEQNGEARFPRIGSGVLYAYCNRHGLYRRRVEPLKTNARRP